MKELTKEQFEQEMKIFEGFCNKIMDDLDNHIKNASNADESKKFINRKEQFEIFVNFIIEKTQFINAPASTRFHLCIPHGTLVHSNSVAKTMMKLNNTLGANIPIYKILITGLFHDLGKSDLYEFTQSDKQKQYGYPGSYSTKVHDEYIEHETESLYLIHQYMTLDRDEYYAIQYHNSPWDGVTKPVFKQNKLLTILSMSDYYSALYLEDRDN